MRKLILSIAMLSLLLMGCEKPIKYEANMESLQQHETPQWFEDAKFGIFIHWGPYSVPAFGSEWYPRLMYQDSVLWHQTDPEKTRPGTNWCYSHHVENYGHPGEFGYKDFIPMFKADQFDATEWISVFKDAGAKYIVPVAEHHDGFAMYASNVTRWNSLEMGPKRDIVGELKAASEKEGLYFGVSSHFAFNWDYYYHKPGFDTNDPELTDLYGPIHEPYAPVSQEFLDLWWARTTDIIDSYEPDILWFDFYWDKDEWKQLRPELAAYYYNKEAGWKKDVVLQSKNFGFDNFPEDAIVWDIERGKAADIRENFWQTDTSIGKNSWCYVSNWMSKTAHSLINDLIDVVSKNGSLLLNIGPKADGSIPQDQKDVLAAMGKWLKINGEAIYATTPWMVFGEGPTEVATGHHTEADNSEFTSADFRFTQNKEAVFAIGLKYPEDNKTTIASFAKAETKVEASTIKAVSLLGSSKEVSWEMTDKGLEVVLPEKVSDYAYVLKIDLK